MSENQGYEFRKSRELITKNNIKDFDLLRRRIHQATNMENLKPNQIYSTKKSLLSNPFITPCGKKDWSNFSYSANQIKKELDMAEVEYTMVIGGIELDYENAVSFLSQIKKDKLKPNGSTKGIDPSKREKVKYHFQENSVVFATEAYNIFNNIIPFPYRSSFSVYCHYLNKFINFDKYNLKEGELNFAINKIFNPSDSKVKTFFLSRKGYCSISDLINLETGTYKYLKFEDMAKDNSLTQEKLKQVRAEKWKKRNQELGFSYCALNCALLDYFCDINQFVIRDYEILKTLYMEHFGYSFPDYKEDVLYFYLYENELDFVSYNCFQLEKRYS